MGSILGGSSASTSQIGEPTRNLQLELTLQQSQVKSDLRKALLEIRPFH